MKEAGGTMGRKSLAIERRTQILDAFERCVIKYGLDGATIEKIAAEANVRPSILRHYIGNWDQLVGELVNRVVKGYYEMAQESFEKASQDDMLPEIMDMLFSTKMDHGDRGRVIFGILMTSEERYPEMKRTILDLLAKVIEMLAVILKKYNPRASKWRCEEVAYSIICLSLSNEAMAPRGLGMGYTDLARAGAEMLLKQFNEDD
jgi:AcrR family transcriptional regulator